MSLSFWILIWSSVLADILLTLKANGVFSEAAFVTGWFSSYLFKLSNLRLCLETAGYAGECWFIWHWRRHCCWRRMLLHCAGVIIPVTSVTFPPKLWPQLWAVLFGSRLPSDVTLNGLEALLWKAAAARVLWNYLLLRNQWDFVHERRLYQGLWTTEFFSRIFCSTFKTNYLLILLRTYPFLTASETLYLLFY